ncbi:MAG: ATP-grasp fold amidoligase family protein [Alphaproteobacteria bacterium]
MEKLARAFFYSLPDEWALQLLYFKVFGRFANLRHPKGFQEKLVWRKLYQRNPRFTLFADKAAVKDEIARLVGPQHVIPTLWTGTDPEDIPFDTLEPPYAIKTNHGSGGHFFIRKAEDIDKKKICASMRQQLALRYGHRLREWAYHDISRKILVERMLVTPQDAPPEDYKFLVFHGRVRAIQIDHDRFTNHTRAFYDRDWKRLPFTGLYPAPDFLAPRPAMLEEMIAVAEKIGSQFDFVRVDLYQIPPAVYFGETTFYPGGGIYGFQPREWELKMGELWKIDTL